MVAPAYRLRTAESADVPGARRVMLDTVYRDFGTGYVPRWHGDIIDVEGSYLAPERHTLLVAEHDGEVVATGGVRSHGPAGPPWLAARYPSGTTAQLCRVYVDPAHRRQGLARAIVDRLLGFIAADGGYTDAYLHTDPVSPGAEAFWTALAERVHDERPEPHGSGTVHFVLPIPARS
ncbi:GNAT family N-acetyltransferase [Catenuloplanes japonicus]|uniref:GNAT family N-acetyltransferase n=1 Tax=Catenuloplanes japonicus TaxID=33876 RepID=UPI000527E656|nr:GNAT family N-acetyltransferase [Catenuloplanes japonicus]